MIRFFFVLLYSYLSDFAWIIRSKNFAKPSLFSLSTVPRVLRVQRYYFFLSLKHFCQLFFIFFHFPSSTLKDNALQRAKQAEKRQFGGLSAKKTLFKGTYRDKKHRKISQIRTFYGKTERHWHAYRTRITPVKAEESTGNGQKAGTPHPRSARSAWNRTDDNGPFARKDAKQRKEKAHLIN